MSLRMRLYITFQVCSQLSYQNSCRIKEVSFTLLVRLVFPTPVIPKMLNGYGFARPDMRDWDAIENWKVIIFENLLREQRCTFT
jgi:hypothetical protein